METIEMTNSLVSDIPVREWFKAAPVTHFPENGGAAVLYNGKQIAVFNFTAKGEWYASQNMCPHKMQMALSRGIIGDAESEPKVSCPFHKKNFSLQNGQCLNDEALSIEVFPVKITDGFVFIGIPEGF